MEQGIFDRIVGVGSLYLNTADPRAVEVQFDGIREPDEVREIVTQYAKRRRWELGPDPVRL
jgi:hypothetical protein